MASFNDNIGEIEKFNPDNYPAVVAEVSKMLQDISHISIYFKKEIVVSYLKDHCIRTEWIEANPKLATLMLSGSLSTTNLESLFESCRWNKTFRAALELYVKQSVN